MGGCEFTLVLPLPWMLGPRFNFPMKSVCGSICQQRGWMLINKKLDLDEATVNYKAALFSDKCGSVKKRPQEKWTKNEKKMTSNFLLSSSSASQPSTAVTSLKSAKTTTTAAAATTTKTAQIKPAAASTASTSSLLSSSSSSSATVIGSVTQTKVLSTSGQPKARTDFLFL